MIENQTVVILGAAEVIGRELTAEAKKMYRHVYPITTISTDHLNAISKEKPLRIMGLDAESCVATFVLLAMRYGFKLILDGSEIREDRDDLAGKGDQSLRFSRIKLVQRSIAEMTLEFDWGSVEIIW